MKQRRPINKRRLPSLIAGAFLLATASGSGVLADPHGNGGGDDGDQNRIQHVLLLSIDGMHALDFLNCSANGTCPNLAALGNHGVNYLNTSTSKPSDSFPGLMALMTGGSPRTMGVNYDVAYDRALNPPMADTGNGLLGSGACTPGTPSGTSTEFDEGININNMPGVGSQEDLNGGAPSGDGGINSIDPTRLERDAKCNPVYPWNFVRVNTIFGVIHGARGYTAWSDKHPSYSSVGGPTGSATDTNVDDYYAPEINSNSANYLNPVTGAFPALIPPGCKPLPDQFAATADDDYTGSFLNIQCYDGLKVNAILNEIDGKNHDGTAKTQVPNIFGMNFQAVSIGQKLIYQHNGGTPPIPGLYSTRGGYTDSIGTPSPSLLQEIEFVDRSIGAMVSELTKQHMLDSTLIIVTAKHGQSPVDSSRYQANGSPNDPVSILSACIPDSELNQIGPTEDDVSLIWLKNTCDVATEVGVLETVSPALPLSMNIAGIGEIFSGPSIGLYYNAGDSRAPDILITPNIGVTYSNSGKKLAEHGGFAHDDVNVMMLLSNPSFHSATVSSPVETAQVAPTILTALGLDPNDLQAVQHEGTQVLPGLPMGGH
ncbi:MAG TPA: alkaline phosphatase family protein [Candidatus Binatus sp.]|uniref:alkaline phosphatase family protein n=1 Tax=Candidatus Binatus sp. TaxID=2811406 RepID=UPI002F3EE292